MGLITNYVKPTKANPYADAVNQLIDAGEGAAYEIVGRTEKVEGVKGKLIASERTLFQAAARDAGYSARVQQSEKREDGTTAEIITLGAKRSKTVKSKTEAEVEGKPVKPGK